jgi:hypothetical protein
MPNQTSAHATSVAPRQSEEETSRATWTVNGARSGPVTFAQESVWGVKRPFARSALWNWDKMGSRGAWTATSISILEALPGL